MQIKGYRFLTTCLMASKNQQDYAFSQWGKKKQVTHQISIGKPKRNQRCFVAMAKPTNLSLRSVPKIADGAITNRVNANLIFSLQV